MKKTAKRLMLCRETVQTLASGELLHRAMGGVNTVPTYCKDFCSERTVCSVTCAKSC